jgi:hypothetical protein
VLIEKRDIYLECLSFLVYAPVEHEVLRMRVLIGTALVATIAMLCPTSVQANSPIGKGGMRTQSITTGSNTDPLTRHSNKRSVRRQRSRQHHRRHIPRNTPGDTGSNTLANNLGDAAVHLGPALKSAHETNPAISDNTVEPNLETGDTPPKK